MIPKKGKTDGESFGDRVRAARERKYTARGKHWTQNDLAKALKVERNTVSRWENGGVLPRDPGIIAELGRVLNVSVEWLLEGLGDGGHKKPAGRGEVRERPQHEYGDGWRAESLPGPAAEVVMRYLDRLRNAGCTQEQINEAERLMVTGAKNLLVRRPFVERELREVIADVDAAWDLVTQILRRQGVRP